MPHPSTQPEILAALESNARDICDFISAQPHPVVFTGDSDHWGPAHHLAHLTETSTAVLRGLRSGTPASHSTGRSRTYAEVRDHAAASLGATPKARLLEMGRVVVIPPGARQEDLVTAFTNVSAELRAAAATWSEEALDRHALRHPLMGELTVREMLLFCIVHERHHLKLVRARLAPA